MNQTTNEDFYFWLGLDGESIPMTEDEFNTKIEDIKKAKEAWVDAVAE